MTGIATSTQLHHHQHKRHRVVSTESTQRRHISCLQPHWIMLVGLSLLMIYIDSKSISAYIIINDRPMTMNLSKYISSIVNALTSVKNRAPALLCGGPPKNQHGTARKTSVRGHRSDDPEIVESFHQQPLPTILAHNNEASIHSRTIDKNEESTSTTNQQLEHDNPDLDAPAFTETIGKSSEASKQQDSSNADVDENDAVNRANDRLSEDTSGNNASDNISTSRPKVLCLSGDSYGRTMNQYLQLATLLHQLGINGTSVVAFKNPLFTSFYTTWFEPRDDIIVKYDDDAPCDAEYDAVTLHYLFFADKWKQVAYQFKALMPKAGIREEAERVMIEYAGPNNVPVTTVHRRDLEGACVLFAESKNLIACPNIKSSLEMSSAEYKDACLIDYPMIANTTHGSSVVLLTDGQVPALDRTFPTISKHPFPIQAWMMAISNVHYGNPFSTVDLVVYFWRMALAELNGITIHHDDNDQQQHMQPSACYKPTPMVQNFESRK